MTVIIPHPAYVVDDVLVRKIDITPCNIPSPDGTSCALTKTFVLVQFAHNGSLRRCVRMFCEHQSSTNMLRSGKSILTAEAFIDLIALSIRHKENWSVITELHNDKHHLGFEGKKQFRQSGPRAGESKGIKWDIKEQFTYTLGNTFTEDLFVESAHPWHIVKTCSAALQSKNSNYYGRTYSSLPTALTECERCHHHRFEHSEDKENCSLCSCEQFLTP